MKSRMPQIIVADDDKTVRTVIVHALSRQGYQVNAATSIAGLWDLATAGRGDVLITDVGFPDGDALELLPRLQERRPELTIIVMSARANLLTAIKTQQRGVFDYLPKPFELKQLLAIVAKAVMREPSQVSASELSVSLPKKLPVSLLGKSPAMQMTFKLLTRMAAQSVPVLIQAEAGSGKQDIANILHEISPLASYRFEAVNLAYTDEGAHEEILFGQEGLLAKARPSVIFINQIELLSSGAQAQLAQFIEAENQIGTGYRRQPSLRLIAGTAQPLKTLVEQGRFREDLCFELTVAVLHVPALRDRHEDVPQIVQFLASEHNQRLAHKKFLDDEALAELRSYHWPGNVGELDRLINHLFSSVQQDRISARHVRDALEQIQTAKKGQSDVGDENLGNIFEQHITRYFLAIGAEDPVPGLHGRILAEIEKPLILATLHYTAGNQIKAAHILGLNRNTLRKKMRELKLSSKRANYRLSQIR